MEFFEHPVCHIKASKLVSSTKISNRLRLQVHKAILALVQSAHPAAVVVGVDGVGSSMLTQSDVMKALALAGGDDPGIGENSVADFMRKHCGRRRLVSAPAHLWFLLHTR